MAHDEIRMQLAHPSCAGLFPAVNSGKSGQPLTVVFFPFLEGRIFVMVPKGRKACWPTLSRQLLVFGTTYQRFSMVPYITQASVYP